MKKQLPFASLEEVFQAEISRTADSSGGRLMVSQAVETVKAFYCLNSIVGVDASIPDNDMLLFEYGTFDWYDGLSERFSVSITRQFSLPEEAEDEFFQLRLELYFPSEVGKAIPHFKAWSCSYKSIDEWMDDIQNSAGYLKTQYLFPDSTTLSLEMT